MRGFSRTASHWEGRYIPSDRILFRSKCLRLTDSPNCETETANRMIQTGSLTVPAEGDKINFLKVAILL